MKKIDLSIIIPHYNTPAMLDKLLGSIPILENIQILIIDDRSSAQLDVYENVKNKWKDSVEFLFNDTNVKGAGICRNIGLSHAKGEWILFADSDDYFLDEMYSEVEKYFDTSYDIVYFSPTSIELETGNLSNRHEQYVKVIEDYLNYPNNENLLKLTSKPFNTPWSKLFRTQFIKENNITFSEILYSNDIMFLAKAGCCAKKICASRKQIYCVTRGNGSLTTHVRWEVFWQRTQEYIKTCAYIRDYYAKKNIDISCLRLTGIGTMYRAMRHQYSIDKYVLLYKEFKKNNISLFGIRTLSIKYVVNQIKKYRDDKKKTERYWIE